MARKNKIRRVDIMFHETLEDIVVRTKALSKRNNESIKFTYRDINIILNHRTPNEKVRELYNKASKRIIRDGEGRRNRNIDYDLSLGNKETWPDRKLKDRVRINSSNGAKNILEFIERAVLTCKASNLKGFIIYNNIIITLDKTDNAEEKILEYYSKIKDEDLNSEEKLERDQYSPYILQKEAAENAKNIQAIKSRKIKKIGSTKK